MWGFHAYVWNETWLFSLINFSHVYLIIGPAKRTLAEVYFGCHILVSSTCSGGTWAIMGSWVSSTLPQWKRVLEWIQDRLRKCEVGLVGRQFDHFGFSSESSRNPWEIFSKGVTRSHSHFKGSLQRHVQRWSRQGLFKYTQVRDLAHWYVETHHLRGGI